MLLKVRSLSIALVLLFVIAGARFSSAQNPPSNAWYLTGSAPEFYEAGWLTDANAAFYLRSRTPGLTKCFGTWSKYVQATPYLGKRVRLRATVEPKDVGGWAGLWMRVDGAGRTLAFDNMQTRSIHGTAPAHSYEVVLDVPSGASGIGFGVLLADSGSLKVSDVAFEIVGADVAITEPGPLFAAPKKEGNWFLAGDMNQFYDAGQLKGTDAGFYLRSRTADPISGFGTWMTMVNAAPYAGKRVRLRGTLTTQNAKGVASLWMRVDAASPSHGGASKSLAFDNMADRSPKGTTDAKMYDVVLDVPAEAKDIAYGVLLDNAGEVHSSNLKLEVVPETVPVTGNHHQ